MFQITPRFNFMKLFIDNRTRAYAQIHGNADYPDVQGVVYFYEVSNDGILVEAEIFGLPESGNLDIPAFYGFHIHQKGDCSDRFENVGGHYNPMNHLHPHHAGDMPPLISSNGYTWISFFDNTLKLYEIIGKAVIIHRNADDFTTQPSGNSGEMIGCGVIQLIDEERNV